MAIRTNEPDFNANSLFDMLLSHLRKDDVLITVATGEMSDAEADRTGLVPTHAYAVLDVQKINVSKCFHASQLSLTNKFHRIRERKVKTPTRN